MRLIGHCDTERAERRVIEKKAAQGGVVAHLDHRPWPGRLADSYRLAATGAVQGEPAAPCGQPLLEELILRHAADLEIPTYEREQQASGAMMLPIPRGGILRTDSRHCSR